MTAGWEEAVHALEATCMVCGGRGCQRLGVWVDGVGVRHVETVEVQGVVL